MDTGSFIIYIKTEDIYSDIAKNVETRYDTSNYELNRLLPEGKTMEVIVFLKNELGGKIMKKFTVLRAKT